MLFRGKHVVVLAEKLTHKQVNMVKTWQNPHEEWEIIYT